VDHINILFPDAGDQINILFPDAGDQIRAAQEVHKKYRPFVKKGYKKKFAKVFANKNRTFRQKQVPQVFL